MYRKSRSIIVISMAFLWLYACRAQEPNNSQLPQVILEKSNERPVFSTLANIPTPPGYQRLPQARRSFGYWLRQLPLKADPTVYLFNGQKKRNQEAQFAVLDISVGSKDLQQCADAAMRLRAEYLFSIAEFSELLFIDNEGGQYRFSPPYSHEHLLSYLEKVFGMCGSASLSKQLSKKVDIADIEPGDLLVRGGFPGHVVTVVDVAVNNTGERVFMLAQSYMPAQDIHVLKNPLHPESPWYLVPLASEIETPEYRFTTADLKRW